MLAPYAPAVTAPVLLEAPAAGPPPADDRLRERLRERLGLGGWPATRADRVWGWLAPLAVFAIALWDRASGVTRVRCTVKPDGMFDRCFDETYYANEAHGLLAKGYETNPKLNAAELVVHPPLGKWMIAVGEQVFGFNELGWRISAVVCGSLTILVFARLVRRMTRSTLLGTLGGLLLSLDGLEYVQSRIGILDIFLLFWLVCALACVVADRDHARGRLARRVLDPTRHRAGSWAGPRLGLRPWRLAAGVSLGAACAVKWSGAPLLVALVLLSFGWDVGARRTAGVRGPFLATLWRDTLPQAGAMLLLPLVVYTASWTGWFVTNGGYDRHARTGSGIINTLDNWLQYQRYALCFHEGLADTPQRKSPLLCDGVPPGCDTAPMTNKNCWSDPRFHAYESKPFGWLTLSRPVAYAYNGIKSGESLDGQKCPATGKDCSRAVLAIDTPALWWAGLLCLPVAVGMWAARRDWRAATAVVGALFAFAPWLTNTQRVMFQFYALPMLPFVVLALVLVLGKVLGPARASENRRLVGAITVGLFTLLVLADFAWLHPILSGQVITYQAWHDRVIGVLGFPGWL